MNYIYEIEGPDGRIYEIEAPKGTSESTLFSFLQSQIAEERRQRNQAYAPAPAPVEPPPAKSGFIRQTADVPVSIAKGAVQGIRMIADAFGADNPASSVLRSGEEYLGGLLSAQAKNDQQEIARIMKEAEDKGALENLKAAVKALSVAPVDLLSQALGTAAPVIVGGLAATTARLGAIGVRATTSGLGVATGLGVGKGAIYEAVSNATLDELIKQGVPPDVAKQAAEQVAQEAQSYSGKNLDQILLSGALGGVAARFGIEPAILGGMSKRIAGRAVATGVAEAIPETAQGAQERAAQNIALQREGYDVPTMRGVIGAGALEGLVGAGVGAGVGAVTTPGLFQAPAPPPPGTPPATPQVTPGAPIPASSQLSLPLEGGEVGTPLDTSREDELTARASREDLRVRADSLREEFDALQNDNARLRRQYDEATDPQEKERIFAEAEALAPRLIQLQRSLQGVESRLPAEERGRVAPPEGQLSLFEPDQGALPPRTAPPTPPLTRQRELFGTMPRPVRTEMSEDLKALGKEREQRAQLEQNRIEADRIREQFDALQNDNSRLRRQFDEATDAQTKQKVLEEAGALAPRLRSLEKELRAVERRLPAEERGRLRMPEEQLGLFEDTTPTTEPPTEPPPGLPAEVRPEPRPITEEDFRVMNIAPSNSKLRELILGKDLADPVQREEVRRVLEQYGGDPKRSPRIATAVEKFLSQPIFTEGAPDVEPTAPRSEAGGEGVPVSGRPDRGVPAEGTEPSVATGMGGTEPGTSGIAGGEAAQQPSVGKTPSWIPTGPKAPRAPKAPKTPESSEARERRLDQEIKADAEKRMSAWRPKTVLENIERTSDTQPAVKTKTPSLKREVRKLIKEFNDGKITAEVLADRLNRIQNQLERSEQAKDFPTRARGELILREKLLAAQRRGELSPEAVALTEWFISQNPALVSDLAVSVVSPTEGKVSGTYNSLMRLITLIKGSNNSETAVHEILHHMERMLPQPIRQAIRKLWLNNMFRAAKDAQQAGNKNIQEYFNNLIDYHVGGAGQGTLDKAVTMIKDGLVPYEAYQYSNPSEFWAVNGSEIVQARFGASQSLAGRIKQWLKEFAAKIKEVLGIPSNSVLFRALDSLAKSDGKFITGEMLHQEGTFDPTDPNILYNIERQAQTARTLNERMKGISNQKPQAADTTIVKRLANNFSFKDFEMRARRQVVDKSASVVDKMNAKFNNAVTDALNGTVRPDLLLAQKQDTANIADKVVEQGGIRISSTGLIEVVDRPATMDKVLSIITDKLGAKVGSADEAMTLAHNALIGFRASELRKFNADMAKKADAAEAKGNILAAKKFRDQIINLTATDEQIAAALEAMRLFPEIKEAYDTFSEFKNGLVDFLQTSGRINAETAKNWKENLGYVPWTRVEEEVNDFKLALKQKPGAYINLSKLPHLDKEGSSKEINNIFDNMVGTSLWLVRDGVENYSNRKVLEALPDAVQLDTEDKVKEAEKKNKERLVYVYEDGEKKAYLLGSPYDLATFTTIPEIKNGFFKLAFAGPAKLLRTTITHMPAFAIGQLIQDGTYRAMLLSGVQRPFSVPPKVFKNFFQLVFRGESAASNELARLGVTGTYDGMPENVISRVKQRVGVEHRNAFKKAWDGLEKFSLNADLAVRAAIYEQSMLESGDRNLAYYRAKEYINFKRQGVNPVVNTLRQAIPFMNAYLQGMDVLYRTIVGKGVATGERKAALKLFYMTGAKLAVLNLLYAMAVSGDDEYEGLDEYIRNRNYIIPGTGVRIPVAPEVGLFFKVIPEQLYRYMTEEGTTGRAQDTKAFMKRMGDALGDALGGTGALPAGVKPVLEVATNYSFFREGPIVGRGMANLEKELQFTEGTSELAKIFGQLSGQSPMMIDHLIRGYTGMASGIVLDLTDGIINPDRMSKPIYKTPQISSFMYDPTGRGFKTDYYNFREDVMSVVDTFNMLKREVRIEELREYMTPERLQVYALKGVVGKIERDLTKLRNYRKIIAQDTSMPPDERAAKVEEILKLEKDIVKAYDIPAMRRLAGF